MNNREIARRRLYNHCLRGAPCATPEDVVRRLAAMQAQEFAYVKWSVAQRADRIGNETIDRLFAAGAILRTHLLRPTWHFVLPEDIRWMLELTAPRVHAVNAYQYRKLDLDATIFARTDALFVEALEGGRHRTRDDLAVVLERAGIVAAGLRLGYIMMRAELDGVICSGAPQGKQQTYALLDERAPRSGTLDRDAALAELIRRYFTSRGPATLKDFAQWSGLTTADGRRGLDMLGPELERVVVDGRTYWLAPSPSPVKRASPTIDLVQCYDEYVMSYSESRDVLRLEGATGKAAYYHAILLDGQVIGHWRHALEKNAITIETQFYRSLVGSEKRALDRAVERYGRFMGLPAALR